jgi:hypothetical protein
MSQQNSLRALTIALLVLTLAASARAQVPSDFTVERTTTPPKMDGILDDEVWKRAPMPTGEWVSYNPVRGDKMSNDLRTEVRIAYDDRNIYFAFHCFDHDPSQIRSNVNKRDNGFADDWVAISLDSAGTGQAAYHLFSNPSASQMDAINTSASGEQFDADVVWFSAARTTSDGYVVEVQIPLQSLRFSGGDQVRMGLVFFRKISRMGVSYAFPEMLPGQWVFDRPAHLLFNNLKPRRLVELLPSVTYGVTQERLDIDKWDRADGDPNVGISGKLGITSNITLDGTINPDFSQVESDAFQVQVNQRFPVFFSEKRPFFMEGMGLFNIAGTGGDGNMRTAVHTRRIIDPIWGSKVTGTAGRVTFGVLNALDEHPQDRGQRGDAVLDFNQLTTIGRATYALRRSDYIGAIFTDTEHAGRRNFVIGGDVSVRPSATQNVSATFLSSQTSYDRDPEKLAAGTSLTVPDTSGKAVQVSYNYETRRYNFGTQFEHYDRDFQMDTAFYNRTGFTGAWSFGEVNFYPKSNWLQRVHPFYFARVGEDEIQDGHEKLLNTGIRFNFTRQGFINLAVSRGEEAWQGEQYTVGRNLNFFAQMQAFRWLEFNGGINQGPAIYYDDVDPFQGEEFVPWFGVTLQPNQHLTQSLDYNHVDFDRADTGADVFSLHIVNARTTYQFDKHFLLRFLAQYDSSAERVLTDFLASYEFVPGTVFHAGYGSLYEKRPQGVDPFMAAPTKYQAVNRGLFFKASYLRRF